MSSPHNLCIRLDTNEKEECLLCMGDRLLGEESVHEYMAIPLITQDSIDQSPNNAQSLSLSKGLVIPMSHDENAHHVDSHNPYRVPPPTSKAKLSPTASHFSELNLCWVGQCHISLEINPFWPWLQTVWPITHAWHVQFPIGTWSTVINSILSSFPKLMCHVTSLGNLIYFMRLYLMCPSTCSIKPIFLVTVATILLLNSSSALRCV